MTTLFGLCSQTSVINDDNDVPLTLRIPKSFKGWMLTVYEYSNLFFTLKKNPWDLHNLLLPLIKKNLLIVTVGHAPKAPTQTPRVSAPQKYKSWIMIDWKILTSRKLFPSSGSQALFSQLVRQEPKKQRWRREFFLGGGGEGLGICARVILTR